METWELDDRGFARSRAGEPHFARRLALLADHPEVRDLMGFDRRTIAVTALVVLAQFTVAALVQAQADHGLSTSGWLAVVLLAYGLGAVLNHWCAMSIHETAHNLAARTPLANRVTALVANVPMVLPCAMTFHRYHIAHHNHLGVDGHDTDLPHRFETRVIGDRPALKAVWLFFYLFVYCVRGTTFAKPFNRAEIVNIVFIVAVDVVIVHQWGWEALAYLSLSTFFGHSLHPVAAHFIHEHYVFDAPQETYSYYGCLNRVTFNVGYHNEHHDLMNIPGSRLPELRHLAPEYYAPLTSHRSWMLVLWTFIRRRGLGVASRIVRSHQDDVAARGAAKQAVIERSCPRTAPRPRCSSLTAASRSTASSRSSDARAVKILLPRGPGRDDYGARSPSDRG